MKIRSAVFAGISVIVVIILVNFLNGSSIEENKIRVAHFPNIGHVVPIIGIETGIFSKNLGSDVIIETKLFDSGPQVIESLFANSIDVGYVGPGPAINGFLKSENNGIKILAGAASGGASFVVHPNSQIKSIKDFSGKRIAAPQIGNTQDVSLRYHVFENGLKPVEKGGSVFILNISNPDIYTLFAKKDIDGAWIAEPWATILVQELDGVRLFHEEDLWPEKQFASVLLIARSDYIDNHPQITKQWIDSHMETVSWINNNPDESEIIFNQFMEKTFGQSLSDEIVHEALSNIKITSDPIDESIYIFAQQADSLGYLGRHGYNLTGIFYDEKVNSSLKEKI